MAVLFRDNVKCIIGALLFAADEPLTIDDICRIVEIDRADAVELIDELKKEYENGNRGLQVVEIADGFGLATKPEFAPYIKRLYKNEKRINSVLSRAALETLVIIAYKQPVSRAEIDIIRGVSSESTINTLLERGLIEETGRLDAPGRPVLYGTTKAFLEYFGLKSISDLPSLDDEAGE